MAMDKSNTPASGSDLDLHLVEFAQLLRKVGLKISSSEIADAAEGISLIGLADREAVEAVLQATLVKNVRHIAEFQEVFRTFFATVEQKDIWQKETVQKAAEWQEMLEGTRQDLRFQDNQLDISEEQRAVYARLPEEKKQRLRDFLEKSSNGMKSRIPVDHTYQPIVERVLRGSLEYWRKRLDEEEMLPSPGSADGILAEVERSLRDREAEILSQDLKNISAEEWPEVIHLIHRLSQRLAGQITRRYRADGRRGGLDMRVTLRKNLRYGGVLVERRFRSRRKGRPQIILLCDISGSMLKYTDFILQFIYGLSTVLNGLKTFAFGVELLPLTGKLRRGQSLEKTVKEALSVTGKEWGGGTNLAAALGALQTSYTRMLTKKSFLLIVSDAQTLEADKAAALLKEIRTQVHQVLWLNTLPERRWLETSYVNKFQPFCLMYECYTLAHLTRILSKQF